MDESNNPRRVCLIRINQQIVEASDRPKAVALSREVRSSGSQRRVVANASRRRMHGVVQGMRCGRIFRANVAKSIAQFRARSKRQDRRPTHGCCGRPIPSINATISR